MPSRVRLRGTGVATLVAHGPVDAERTLEKELCRALPGSGLNVREIRRLDEEPRLVESFALTYILTAEVEVEGEENDSARTAAFRVARRALEGTRFARVAWEPLVSVTNL